MESGPRIDVDVRFWGLTARLAGGETRRLRLPVAATVADAVAALQRDAALAPELPRCAYALGDAIVWPGHALVDGDELSVLPPVSGG